MPVKLNAKRLIDAVAGGKFALPQGGWNSRTFSTDGSRLVIMLARVSKITQRNDLKELAIVVNAAMKNQVSAVIRRANALAGQRSAKAEVTIQFNQHSELWARAIREVFAESETVEVIQPRIQSTMAQGYSRTGILLGQEADPSASPGIARQAAEQTRKLSGIDDTSQAKIMEVVSHSIEQGETVAETSRKVQDHMDRDISSRSMTIARTETMTAWNRGSIQAFRESRSLTHCSVIGCESRERHLWHKPYYQQFMFRGESTCNIQDVLVSELDKLNFHPNHTGVIVPSRFV